MDLTDDDSRRRIVANERRFAALNQALRADDRRLGAKTDVVCECGRPDCHVRLDIGDEQWRGVHAHADRYVVALGHELPAAERVVSSNERFSVVEKLAETTGSPKERGPGA